MIPVQGGVTTDENPVAETVLSAVFRLRIGLKACLKTRWARPAWDLHLVCFGSSFPQKRESSRDSGSRCACRNDAGFLSTLSPRPPGRS